MKVAITGTSGHIGNNLARTLIEQGASVTALCHRDTRALDGLNLERIYGSVLNPDSLMACFHEAEVVYHLASVISIDGDPRGIVRGINQSGTRFVIKACLRSGVRKLIHFSSIHALQQHPLDQILDESRPLVAGTGSIYDQSKAESERIVLTAIQQGLEVVIISPTGVLGPHDYKPSFMGQAIISLYQGKLPALIPGGFNWVDVRDVVQGTIQASKLGKSGERYLLSGTWVPMTRMAEMIAQISEVARPKFTVPFWLAHLGLPFILAFSKLRNKPSLYTSESLSTLKNANRKISSHKAEIELGFQSRPLQETLEDTFEWYKQAGMLV